MGTNLWIFDYDNTLMPSYISNIIINKSKISENDINEIIIILLNIIITMNKIIELNGKIIILTAALNPWVYTTLRGADKIIKENRNLINYKIIKENTITYNYNNIKNILNIDNFFTKYITNKINDEIFYVHEIERLMFINERTDKNNSLKYILHKNTQYNNIIILGDAYENERKYAIQLAKRKNENKKIKFVQYYNTDDITIKIHEQHLLFHNIEQIINISDNVIFDINE